MLSRLLGMRGSTITFGTSSSQKSRLWVQNGNCSRLVILPPKALKSVSLLAGVREVRMQVSEFQLEAILFDVQEAARIVLRHKPIRVHNVRE